MSEKSTLRPGVVLLLVVAAVTVVVGAVVWLVSTGDDDGGPAADDPTTTPGAPSETFPEPDTVPQEAKDAAAEGVRLFTEYAYTDTSPTAWVERVAEVSTDTYADFLRERYGNDENSQDTWDRFVVPDKEAYRTEVSQVELDTSGKFESTDEGLVFEVTYRTAMKSTNTGGEWTDPPTDLHRRVTVTLVDGEWLVNDIRGVGGEDDGDQV